MFSGSVRQSGAAFITVAVLCLGLAGCGDAASRGITTTPTTPVSTNAITVTPASTAITTAQSLAVTVTLASGASGTVVLSSGNYASFPMTISNNTAAFTIPAGLLPVGTDTLTATYLNASSSTGTATATVTVTSGGTAPTVTATSVTYPTLGKPFRAIQDGLGDVLVSVTDTTSTSISGVQVFTEGSNGLTSNCDNLLRPGFQQNQVAIDGLSLFNKGANLVAGIESAGILLFPSIAAFKTCNAQGTQVTQGAVVNNTGSGTFDAVVTPDGKYAFVANEYGYAPGATTSGNVGVVSLQYDSTGALTGGTLVGQISTGGTAVPSVALSPDGTRLYVTTEIDASNNQVGSGNSLLARTGCTQGTSATSINGLLTVIDVAKAEASPGSSAIINTIDAGCSPVRSLVTADGSTLWVAVRGDNRLLAFSTGMLERSPANALLGHVDNVGSQPVGLSFLNGQKLLAVANSNRFGGGTANAVIVSIAVPSTASVVQTIATGLFPREITTEKDDTTLLLTNYNSNSVQVVTTSTK